MGEGPDGPFLCRNALGGKVLGGRCEPAPLPIRDSVGTVSRGRRSGICCVLAGIGFIKSNAAPSGCEYSYTEGRPWIGKGVARVEVIIADMRWVQRRRIMVAISTSVP